MKIAICDDVLTCVNDIKKLLSDTGVTLPECDVFHSGEALLADFADSPFKYDIVFLDMEMTGLNGIETGKQIREKNENVLIIFVTYHERYMKDSFLCRPFRFITKPIDNEEFSKTINEAVEFINRRKTCLSFKHNKTVVNIPFDEIVYCECQGHEIWIYTEYEKFKMLNTIEHLSNILIKGMFGRPHKSYVVNFKYIRSVSGGYMNLVGFNQQIPLGRTYRKQALADYKNYLKMVSSEC